MLSLLTIAGGLALILFGVRHLRKGLDRLFGERLGDWLQRLSGNRIKSFISGVGVSMFAPSSTTMSVLAVQMVQAGHMNARAMLALMLGVDIGLTVTVLLISLQLDQFAMVLILFGVIGFQFTSRSRSRGVGQLLLALGLIFLAIGTIKSAAGGVSNNADLIEVLRIASHYPLAIPGRVAGVGQFLWQSTRNHDAGGGRFCNARSNYGSATLASQGANQAGGGRSAQPSLRSSECGPNSKSRNQRDSPRHLDPPESHQ